MKIHYGNVVFLVSFLTVRFIRLRESVFLVLFLMVLLITLREL